MLKQQKIFFNFLRFCIGSAKEMPDSLKEADWKELYAIAKKQCLVGVLSDGIKKLPAEHVRIKKGVAPIDGGPSKIFASFCGMGPPGEGSL